MLFLQYTDRTIPLDKHLETMMEVFEISGAPINPQMFGNAGIEHMRKYGTSYIRYTPYNFCTFKLNTLRRDLLGTKPEHFAKIAYKNHKHSTNNPLVFCWF